MIEISIMNTDNQIVVGMWDDLCRAYGVSTSVYDGEIGKWKRTNFKKDCKVVWVTGDGDIDLKDFVHPANAIYIFGSDDRHNDKPEEASISIRIPLPTKNKTLRSSQAGAIILYDIWSKNG